MEHILRAADVAAAIRDTLAGKRTKVQLAMWAHLAMLADDAGTTHYDSRHKREIHAVVYQLMFMSEGPEYELDDVELHAIVQVLEEVQHAYDDAKLQAMLRLLPQRIADAIRRNSDEQALRCFACACARQGLMTCGIEEPLLLRALHLAGNPTALNPDELTRLHQEVSARVEQMDDLAFQAQEAQDRNGGSRDEYIHAFRAARAATSVLCTLEFEYPAELAFAEACYEAFHALDVSQAESVLLEIAQRSPAGGGVLA